MEIALRPIPDRAGLAKAIQGGQPLESPFGDRPERFLERHFGISNTNENPK